MLTRPDRTSQTASPRRVCSGLPLKSIESRISGREGVGASKRAPESFERARPPPPGGEAFEPLEAGASDRPSIRLDGRSLSVIGIATVMESPGLRRQTRQRRLVYEAVAATDTHPTAAWVYNQVRRAMPRVSLGTVLPQPAAARGRQEVEGLVARPHDSLRRRCLSPRSLPLPRLRVAPGHRAGARGDLLGEAAARARPSHREPDSGIHWRLPEVPTAPLTSTGGKRIWRP